jgi:hypothetical protein
MHCSIETTEGSIMKDKSSFCEERDEKLFTFSLAFYAMLKTGNTKGGSITIPLTSCLTDLESAV